MKIRIALMYLLLATGCIVAENNQIFGELSANMWNRLAAQGVALKPQDLAAIEAKIKNNGRAELFNAMMARSMQIMDEDELLPDHKQILAFRKMFLHECNVLTSYYLRECLPPTINPMYSLERRMLAILALLAFYDELITGADEKEPPMLKEVQHKIEDILTNINTTHMIVLHPNERNLEIVD